ncbi:hypothetical protein [Sphingomonas pseudosanguinis]|uniref:Uncharacterized protein n=1 Tax=Sphingomonas pseudosanguinis TaxID=413712 RepID=A0A7W6A8A6_9SPHN|nr:hypothetical protein [Sphingomonas pseudosanguinis]MBB3877880.1 hypothetical protein [Sphingomonas pseudosanguinis]MBN3537754.1 hypothetical protein [Sphingomonas pseudosanguinis]
MTRDEARLTLRIALGLYKRSEKKVMGINTEILRDQMVEDILRRMMGSPHNESVILRPSNVVSQAGEREGYWDRDEPHPVPILERNNITFES